MQLMEKRHNEAVERAKENGKLSMTDVFDTVCENIDCTRKELKVALMSYVVTEEIKTQVEINRKGGIQ